LLPARVQNMHKIMKKISIIGAGLAGSLLANLLAPKGFEIELIEARPDMRKGQVAAGRSINLALSARGIAALKKANLLEQVLAEAVPMRGRMMHGQAGELNYMPYSNRPEEYINSISRGNLNRILLTAAEKHPNVRAYFSQHCLSADFETHTFETQNADKQLTTHHTDLIIGTDGANSAVRAAFEKANPDFTQHTTWENYGYKELNMPAAKNGGFRMDKNSLHIWARGAFMLIALPNFDGSFTCTLFLPLAGGEGYQTNPSFESLKQAPQNVGLFFKEYFADILPHIPDFAEQFEQNPIGKLGTLRCSRFNHSDISVLLGDAAHAVVPFYGQGMNASFEDCIALVDCMDANPTDWAAAFEAYNQLRKPNSDAIATLALENFVEMRDKVADEVFIRKRKLELGIEKTFPDYLSKYSMVTFHPEIPYTTAHSKGWAQDEFLMQLCTNPAQVPSTEQAYEAMQKYFSGI
jgi:kynurenine 3-monooxygenase